MTRGGKGSCVGTIATGGSIGGVYWPVAVGVGSKVSGGAILPMKKKPIATAMPMQASRGIRFENPFDSESSELMTGQLSEMR
jgi:hypothetical protein